MKNKIRYYRHINNEMTQQQLAQKVNVARQTIIAIEKGSFNPSVKLALKIAHVFQIKVDDLFELDEDELPETKEDAS
ncbi:helix-turn-helix transcriptional regulator [Caldithrix abyssi]|nr:helix-turn-helix transcriptional regulator [Caldithrix abyssi]APF19964.1 putative transcriptional regulator [Caldithrix abyssi DSM 13497]